MDIISSKVFQGDNVINISEVIPKKKYTNLSDKLHCTLYCRKTFNLFVLYFTNNNKNVQQ